MNAIKLQGRVRTIKQSRNGNTVEFLCPDNLSQLKQLLSRSVVLQITENGHQPLQSSLIEEPADTIVESELITVLGQPQGKPRMVDSDRFKPSSRATLEQRKRYERIQRYWSYCDKVREVAEGKLPASIEGVRMQFFFAMPVSWSNSQKLQHDGKRHFDKPDLDNCVKGILDALLENDEIIAKIEAEKFWTLQQPRTEIIFY